ncbi:MAG: triose-phosphate transporter family protein [Eubacterium sp.]|jgi:drug/metabolite transporter (DMT)-like permease|nr:triose-phosphate transporter family protein [Eubacterium sp.]
MNDKFLFVLVFLCGVIIASFSQILLKKSAAVKHGSLLKEYFNFKVFFAYALFVASTLCTLIAYKEIPLSWGAILGTSEYIVITILSRVFLKEKPSKKKILGLAIIIAGIVVYTL